MPRKKKTRKLTGKKKAAFNRRHPRHRSGPKKGQFKRKTKRRR